LDSSRFEIHIVKLYPETAQNLESCLTSVDRKFASDDTALKEDCEVAFFPPVSGGATLSIIKITRKKLDVNTIVSQLTTPGTGAIDIFVGVVRENTKGADKIFKTRKLEYEAYEAMALETMREIETEIRGKWISIEGVAIIQRIGTIAAGTPSVIIACSSSHRDQGVFEATRFAIDRLKQIVPIWKKEISDNGEEWIDGDYIPKSEDCP